MPRKTKSEACLWRGAWPWLLRTVALYMSLRSSVGSQHPASLQLFFLLTAFCILNQLGLGEWWPILNYVIYTGSKGKSKTFVNPKGNDQLVLCANCFSLA